MSAPLLLGLVLLFELLAVSALLAALRGRALVVASVQLAALGGLCAVQRSLDPGLFLAAGVLAGAGIGRALRQRYGTWMTVVVGLVPVCLGAVAGFVGSDPQKSWNELRTQVEQLATSSAVPAPSGKTPPPEEQQFLDRTHELAGLASRWALRLVPAGIATMALLQVLPLVLVGATLGRRRGLQIRVPPFVYWQVPFASVWVLAAGLGLIATRLQPAVIAGANLVVGVAVWLALQGLAVLLASFGRGVPLAVRVFGSPRPGRGTPRFMAVAMMLALAALGLVLVLTSLLVWPVPLGSLALVGLADLWIDFRRQRVAADDS